MTNAVNTETSILMLRERLMDEFNIMVDSANGGDIDGFVGACQAMIDLSRKLPEKWGKRVENSAGMLVILMVAGRVEEADIIAGRLNENILGLAGVV